MRILVCVRPVHNPVLPVGLNHRSDIEALEGYRPVPNPQDECALEYALRLKDRCGAVVTVLSVGGASCKPVLDECIACGADHAVWLEQPCQGPDSSIIAERIVAYARSSPSDLYLFGFRDLDRSCGEVGPMVAALARVHYIAPAIGVDVLSDHHVLVRRKVQQAHESVSVSLPVCIGVLRGPPLRYPSLFRKVQYSDRLLERIDANAPRNPVVVHVRLASAKPTKRAPASTVQGAGGTSRIAQALGLSSGGTASSHCMLLHGDPEVSVRQLFERIWREGLLPECS